VLDTATEGNTTDTSSSSSSDTESMHAEDGSAAQQDFESFQRAAKRLRRSDEWIAAHAAKILVARRSNY
jgi:hypothetical protein